MTCWARPPLTEWPILLAFLLMVTVSCAGPVLAQDVGVRDATKVPSPSAEDTIAPGTTVSVVPKVGDREIADRLTRILNATGWFRASSVEVRDGVVFLDGATSLQDQRRWASELAKNTEGTVAVVNRIQVEADVRSTFERAGSELERLGRQALQIWPLVLLALLIIAAAWLLSKLVAILARRFFVRRIRSPLLVAVVIRLFSIPVFLLGVYFVLQVAGLTRLAITVLGGTGLIGIVIGFAFRDIAENFLASLLLSIRNPFGKGDLIEVAGHTGIVQNLNTRSTVLLTLDGNHVQIPNATVYKNTITNFSSTPSRRAEFTVGIGYDSSTAKAQALVGDVLRRHPAVLDEPEPLVLVAELGAATVNLKARYWFDSGTYAPDKINSALLRLCKNALLQGGIELPDPAREVVFPRGVPIVHLETAAASPGNAPPLPPADDTSDVTADEGRLTSECVALPGQGEVPDGTENLLKR